MTYSNIHPDDLAAEMVTEADVNRERYAADIADAAKFDAEGEERLGAILDLEERFGRLLTDLPLERFNQLAAWVDRQLAVSEKKAAEELAAETKANGYDRADWRPGSAPRKNYEQIDRPFFICRQCEAEYWDENSSVDDGGDGWICVDCSVTNKIGATA